MLYENTEEVNDFQRSSFVSPPPSLKLRRAGAHGCGGTRATIKLNNSPSAKKSGEARKRASKNSFPQIPLFFAHRIARFSPSLKLRLDRRGQTGDFFIVPNQTSFQTSNLFSRASSNSFCNFSL